jgi:hypothetical protein
MDGERDMRGKWERVKETREERTGKKHEKREGGRVGG